MDAGAVATPGVTQAYVSLLEKGRRRVPMGSLVTVRALLSLSTTSLVSRLEEVSSRRRNEWRAEPGEVGLPVRASETT